MKKLNLLTVLVFLFIFFSTCNHDYTPKPRGFYRITLPDKKYTAYDPHDCPFSFEIPQYAKVLPDTNRLAEPCWMYITFPPFNAQIYLTYKTLHNDLNKYTEDAHTLVYKHTVKANGIDEKLFNTSANVHGILYEIGGNAASAVQFYATDSIRHFLRGSLYFNCVPHSDSLAPVIDFLQKDVEHIVNSLKWKN